MTPRFDVMPRYLVFIRTDDKGDELYRAVGAESQEDVLEIIAGEGVSMNRVIITRPASFMLQIT